MTRIRSKGLDYFPLSTQYVNNRLVRRLMKQEGDRALTVLIHLLSMLYAGEGYYLRLDDVCCDDLADRLYQTTPDEVRNIARCAVELGLFDSHLYEHYGVLTSVEIQQQFLFCTKRRRNLRLICPEYNLIAEDEAAEEPADMVMSGQPEEPVDGQPCADTMTGTDTQPADDAPGKSADVWREPTGGTDGEATPNCAKTSVCVTQNAQNAHLNVPKYTKQSKEKKTTPCPRL